MDMDNFSRSFLVTERVMRRYLEGKDEGKDGI